MKFKPLPPAQFLRECFSYYPDTGEVRWRNRPLDHFVDERSYKLWNTKHADRIAGIISEGRRNLTINNQRFETSRVIWKLVTGEDPDPLVDHRDRNPLNNRWDNLRKSDFSQNRANSGGDRVRVSRFKGVSRHTHGRWQAQITFRGQHFHLGLFDEEESAHEAYMAKSRELSGEFAVKLHGPV